MRTRRRAVARAALRIVARAGAALVVATCASAATVDSPIAPAQRRSAEQTLLTYPEWFLVHSPAEYATLVATRPSHEFPFIAHIGQLWDAYAAVTREQIREHAPVNAGYHAMIVVIAGSTSVEYALRGAYENTFGRVGWALGGDRQTDEDRYAARVAQDYVDFIRREPWYLFDFRARLAGLWRDVPAFGPGIVRKWERRYALTTEYAVKAIYGKLIERATRAAYDPAELTTDVVVDRVPARLPADTRVLQTLDDGRAILELPRYDEFRLAATALANDGTTLVDIAGNSSSILVTVWTRDPLAWPAGTRILFEQPIVTVPGTRRVAALVPVAKLSGFLVDAGRQRTSVEHVYDY